MDESFVHSSKSNLCVPCTILIEVMPRRTEKHETYCFGILFASAIGSGRGPTNDISPFILLISCGSSSSPEWASSLPIFVNRGSFLILNTGPSASLSFLYFTWSISAPTYIVLILCILNGFLSFPARIWVNRNGPREVLFTRIYRIRKIGMNTMKSMHEMIR